MSNSFKQKLVKLYGSDRDSGGFEKKFAENELKQIIRYGAMGEVEDNYYLFIYRDYYRDAGFYGAIVFLNKRDRFERPVTVWGIESDGVERVRNVFVEAALFYLKHDFQATMTVSGKSATLFELAKNKINAHIGESQTPLSTTDLLADFSADIAGQEIKYRQIKTKKMTRSSKSMGLEKNLNKLEIDDSYQESEADAPPRSRAKPGLNLRAQVLDLIGEKHFYLQPLLLPLQADGRFNNPQKVPASGINRFEIITDEAEKEAWDILQHFFGHMAYIDGQPGNPGFKIKLMQHLYFRDTMDALFALPEGLVFCQPDGKQKEYRPLKTFKFERLCLRFAPSLKANREYMLRFFLTFTDADGTRLDAGDRYEIILNNGQEVYVFFETADGNARFTAPSVPERYYAFFDFLSAQGECRVSDLEDILAALKKLESEYLVIQPEPLKKYELTFMPVPVLNIYPSNVSSGTGQCLLVTFDYDSPVRDFVTAHPDKIVCTYQTNDSFESRCLDILKQDPLLTLQMGIHPEHNTVCQFYSFKGNDPIHWLIERGGKYLEKGFKIYSIKWKRFIAMTGSTVRIHVDSSIDWLQFKPMLHDPAAGTDTESEIDPDQIDIQNRAVMDKKGLLHLVTQEEIDKLLSIYRYAQRQGNWFRVPTRNHVLIRKLYDEKMVEIPGIQDILAAEERLQDFEKIPDYPLSDSFNGQLRGYQHEGFKWLYFLQDYRFSGCLADDMGLGKTVQTLALLRTLKSEGKLDTSLLVVPVSAIPNWEAETKRFAPGLSMHRHIGPNRDKETGEWTKTDLVITSYATLRNDIEMIQDFPFDYIILDEPQNIKNLAALTTKAVKVLKARNRLALSGTPVENNSMELWSLFDFLLPGYLGTFQWFSNQFARAIEQEDDTTKTKLLRSMIYPFFLRRKKEAVETELPEKTEIVSTLPMEEEQAKLYATTARFYRGEVEAEMEEKGVTGSSMKILEGMLRLRQVCLFPRLVDVKYDAVPSAKFDHLKELLEDILTEGHKVLIFSQFVQVLKLIKAHCDEEGIGYSYIDGSVNLKSREKAIADFQENNVTDVFLLSLKAGGVALNLTAADYVIIFDPWWNPAVEAQAIDRSHRIGQTKKVMVYRMVVEGTIEEKMLELQERKKVLVENLITADSGTFKNLKKEDILNLFN
jgi:superfamily II DNA or RNA helicase